MMPSTRMDSFSGQVGEVLRRRRQELGLTLLDVQRISRGGFKPSTVAGYERGERMISLERFRALAELYRVPADRLLARALEEGAPARPDPLVIDLDRISKLAEPERMIVAEHVHSVRTQRRDFLSPVVTLRSRDLEQIALTSKVNARVLLDRLRPALATRRARRLLGEGKFPTAIEPPRSVRTGGSQHRSSGQARAGAK